MRNFYYTELNVLSIKKYFMILTVIVLRSYKRMYLLFFLLFIQVIGCLYVVKVYQKRYIQTFSSAFLATR